MNLERQNLAALVPIAARGDEEAQRELWKLSGDYLLRRFIKRYGTWWQHEAEQFLTTFLGDLLMSKLAEFDVARVEGYESWLWSCANRAWIDSKRAEGKHAKSRTSDKSAEEAPSPSTPPPDRASAREQIALIDRVLNDEPLQRRVVFLLLYPLRPLEPGDEYVCFERLFQHKYENVRKHEALRCPSVQDIARLSGLSEDSVRRSIYLTRERLRSKGLTTDA